MSLPRKAFGVQMEKSDLLVSALANNKDRVARRGLDDEFITRFSERLDRINGLNRTQEKAKADLKRATAGIEREMVELRKEFSEAKKVVKLEFPCEDWREFGITDGR
jgi:hypothetical protein